MAITPNTPDPTTGSTHQVVAMFETFERANEARAGLIDAGVRHRTWKLSTMIGGILARPMYGATRARGPRSGSSSFREEDYRGYEEGLRRGHAMLVVRPRAGERERVIELLECFEPVDFDAQVAEWRRTGWQDRPIPAANSADRAGAGESGDQTIPVVQEQVRIGKRMTDRGGVRVRSYVVERPVSEDVTLREEQVHVERHPIDRPVGTVPDEAFRERTIEVSAHGEEPIVQKDARVVEEVTVHKDVAERSEKVQATERKTEVQVEDKRKRKRTDTGRRSQRPLRYRYRAHGAAPRLHRRSFPRTCAGQTHPDARA